MPLGIDLRLAPQAEPAEAGDLLELAEDRLHDDLRAGIVGTALLRAQLAGYALAW